jgi:hypothetical protein
MAISLITSLYRSEKHLPHYIKRVQQVAAQLEVPLEIVIVANDATHTERQLLDSVQQSETLTLNIIQTERETLYASWNRGFETAQYDNLGSWNVDDIRTVEGIIAGYEALGAGFQLVDLDFDLVQGHEVARFSAPYRPDSLAPKTGVSPFFMFRRELYLKAGAFSPFFTITGDFEWSKRPVVREAIYQALPILGGQFVLHDGNLSGGRNPLEWVEFNTALIWHGGYEHLRPVDPDTMRQSWETWGYTGGTIPDDIAAWLWGAGAHERYEAYLRERNAHPLLRRIRLALARRGLVKSVEWDAHQK